MTPGALVRKLCPCFLPAVEQNSELPTSNSVIGVARVIIQSAHLKHSSTLLLPPNPFVVLTTHGLRNPSFTSHRHFTYDPNWIMQSQEILIFSTDSALFFDVFDHSKYFKNTLIASASISVDDLVLDSEPVAKRLPLSKNGGLKGELLASVSFHPILPSTADSNVGVVHLSLDEAKDLKSPVSSREANPRATIMLAVDGKATRIHSTPLCRSTSEPKWHSRHTFLCTDKASSVILVDVSDCGFKETNLGYMYIPLRDLLDRDETLPRWWALSGSQAGQLKMGAEWKPLKADLLENV
ncbi:uncharacterized protein BT62DRAFT_496072 [Guyanagaster necrorhizus]|uniref:C2 domain-containing protein n=1 Tax=Guyanagaster necrorhizus TaxID=856835 RepID=A0A9P7W0Z5_9AGAR|nr:uncharacterized protein BT62DRAFT_496072 [Guyanagaster necrorhizus MCA 3950]KAG7450192.1 hypothetical protein BT62DRAFT_496072 [Guyanagaster necrorhizus MCA 3950]